MHENWWSQPVATLVAAVLAAVVVIVGWWVTHRRYGRWESVKTDLDIAERLPLEDPMKAWLVRYASTRVRYFAAAELRGPWLNGERIYGALMLVVGVGTLTTYGFYLAADVGRPIWEWIGLSFAALVGAGCPLLFAGIVLLHRGTYRVRGLSKEQQAALQLDIDNLTRELVNLAPKDEDAAGREGAQGAD